MSMMSNDLMSSACEVDICGVIGMHALAAGIRNAERAARLEQQLRRRSGQGRLLPLQQSAEAFLSGGPDGLPGDHRRHGRQGEYVRHLRRPREGVADEHMRASRPTTRRARSAAIVGEGEFTDDPLETFGGAGVVRDPATCRICCASSASAASSITWRRISSSTAAAVSRSDARSISVGTCTGTQHEHRCRRRFRHAERARIYFRSEKGKLGSGAAEYPLHRRKDDPDHATQSHADHMNALAAAMRKAIAERGIDGRLDRGDCARYHRIERGSGRREPGAAGRLLSLVRSSRLGRGGRDHCDCARSESSKRSTGAAATYSSEWGFSKLLHWLRHNPAEARPDGHGAGALRHGRRRRLCGITDPSAGPAQHLRDGPQVDVERSRSAGCRRRSFWHRWIRCLKGVRASSAAVIGPPTISPAAFRPNGRRSWGCAPGIPIPVGAFDAHWDAIGAGVPDRRRGERDRHLHLHHGDQRRSRADPGRVRSGARVRFIRSYTGIEAGLSATGDIFEAIARRAGSTVAELSQGLTGYRAGRNGTACG